jgi:hypothetical protein
MEDTAISRREAEIIHKIMKQQLGIMLSDVQEVRQQFNVLDHRLTILNSP